MLDLDPSASVVLSIGAVDRQSHFRGLQGFHDVFTVLPFFELTDITPVLNP